LSFIVFILTRYFITRLQNNFFPQAKSICYSLTNRKSEILNLILILLKTSSISIQLPRLCPISSASSYLDL